jgi:hypothetical protein
VCRSFRELIGSLCELQFRLELDAAGYVEPDNSRADIDIGEKLSILRNHMSRWREHTPSSVEEIYLRGQYHGSRVSNGGTGPLFSGGVLARWSAVDVGSYLPLRLDLVQLPSPNKGTSLKKWHVTEPTVPVRRYWLEPRYDLLVLLAVTGLPPGA